jgi:hypothetical protein
MHHQWDNNQYLLDTVDMIYDLLGERVRNSLGIWDTTPFLLHKVTHKKYVIGLDPWIGLWCFVPFSTLKVKVPKLEVPSHVVSGVCGLPNRETTSGKLFVLMEI